MIRIHPQAVDCGRLRALGLASLALVLAGRALSQPLPSFDFTSPADTTGWAPTHDISSLSTTRTGLLAQISGGDPYTVGPQRDYPTGVRLWLRLKLLSDAGGSCQVFYFGNVATGSASVRFSIPAGQWTEGRVAVPALGPGYRMRVDPPGTTGTATFASLRFEEHTMRRRPARGPEVILPTTFLSCILQTHKA